MVLYSYANDDEIFCVADLGRRLRARGEASSVVVRLSCIILCSLEETREKSKESIPPADR
jgi:hypothetical protein